MYGLINSAIEGMIKDQYGDVAWTEVLRKADTGLEMFVSMESYDDAVTEKLVRAASEVLNVRPESFLESLGKYWILYTAREGYGEMLNMFGTGLKEFLLNLNNLHSRVALIFPKLKPPVFETDEVPEEKTLLLHYYSERAGLAPMVVGLLKGLAERFGDQVEIKQIAQRMNGEHDTFRIRFV